MKGKRSRVYAYSPEHVWETVGDPGQLSRWWPKIERIESSENTGFTEVFRAKSGRTVRRDHKIAALEPEREIAFVQQVEGTPFERVLASSRTTIRLKPEEGGTATRVEVEVDQVMKGVSRLGSPYAVRALKAQLDQALDGLTKLL